MALQPSKLRDSGDAELAKEERELRDQVWKLRLQHFTGQVQDPFKAREARKDLARVLTIRRERDIARAKGQK
jgi:large subunit ribosomal protein L29